jgi:RNA exonuclease 4
LQSAAAGLASPAPTLQVEPVNVANHRTPRLALDCEMVGVGDGGKRSALARVVIVSFDERIAYATFVRPPEQVTDFRTAVSGVRPEHMAHALPFRRVQAEVAAILRDRTVIGHAVHNDLKSLMLEHPKRDLRDTATYPAYRKQQGAGSRPRRLRWLAQEFLGWEIQGDEHSPAEDAVAALRLYKLRMNEWERAVLGGRTPQAHTQTSGWERALAKGNKTKDDLRRSGAAIKKRRKIKRGTN